MKRLCLALAVCVFATAGLRQSEAANVSVDFFYTNLEGGNWIAAGDYGYCWQPGLAANNPDWRPYTDGYWAYTDVGWTWVSYEDFGWATYHYGRWARLNDYGWVWIPGTEWGPAWVSWRTGGDYVGWAPLPPRRHGHSEPIYEGRPVTGYVDVDYDIGPVFYNFVDIRYIGEPLLRDRIFAADQNISYIGQTVNVTNIAYRNGSVYNYGPDYQQLSRYSTRPIQRLRLERARDVDLNTTLQSGALTKVEGDRLLVAAPQKLQRAKKDAAPAAVKAKLEKPDIQTGWSGISDPQAKAQLQEKFKKENRKSIPPPQVQPTNAEGERANLAPNSSAENTAPSSLKYEKPGKNPKKDPDLTSLAQPQPNEAAATATGEKAKGPRLTNPGMDNASAIGAENHAQAVERATTNQAKAVPHHADAKARHGAHIQKAQQQDAARQAQLHVAHPAKQPGPKHGGAPPKAEKKEKKGKPQ